MIIDFKLKAEVSEDEVKRFFRERGIIVKQVETVANLCHCFDEYYEAELVPIWVVVNPHNRQETPMIEKYKELISAQAKKSIIDNIDKFSVFASFL